MLYYQLIRFHTFQMQIHRKFFIIFSFSSAYNEQLNCNIGEKKEKKQLLPPDTKWKTNIVSAILFKYSQKWSHKECSITFFYFSSVRLVRKLSKWNCYQNHWIEIPSREEAEKKYETIQQFHCPLKTIVIWRKRRSEGKKIQLKKKRRIKFKQNIVTEESRSWDLYGIQMQKYCILSYANYKPLQMPEHPIVNYGSGTPAKRKQKKLKPNSN